MDPHWYVYAFLSDGDHVQLVSMDEDGIITVHTSWLVPGTQLED